MAAVFDAGPDAAVSHLAAARWGIPGFGQCRLTLTDSALAVVDGIPLTTLARTIFDLAAFIHRTLGTALDNSLARRLTSLAAVRQVATDIGGRGRAGSALMRKLLEVRGTDYVAPESRLGARFLQILDSANIPRPKLQCDLGGDDWIGRVDGFYPDLRLVIEIDSALHHTTLSTGRPMSVAMLACAPPGSTYSASPTIRSGTTLCP